MEKQEKVQTFYESLHIMFDAEIRVNFDYNKITRSTPFIHRSASVFTEGDCRHFQRSRYVESDRIIGIYRKPSLVKGELKFNLYSIGSHPCFPDNLRLFANGKNFDLNIV